MKSIKKNKYVFIVAILLFSSAAVNAQLTLQQALDEGAKNSQKIKSSFNDYQAAQWQLKATDGKVKIPSFSFGLGVNRNLIIPSTPVPLNQITGQGDPNTLDYLKFGTKWQSNVGLSLNYDLFNPANKQQIDQQRQQTKLAEINLEQAKNSVRYSIMQAYAEAILAKAQLLYAVQDTVSSEENYQTALTLSSEGREDNQSLNNIRVANSDSKSRYLNALMVYKQSQMELAYQLGLNSVDSLPEINGYLTDFMMEFNDLSDNQTLNTETLSYQKLENQLEYDKKNLQHLQYMFLPTVGLKASYGSDYYQNSTDFFNTKNWYGNSAVGVNVNIPILENLVNSKKIHAAKFDVESSQGNIDDYKNRLKTDVNKALIEINTYNQLMLQKQNEMQYAEKNYKLSKDLFDSGRKTSSDLTKDRLNYENAKTNYLQATYNYILSRISLLKILGS